MNRDEALDLLKDGKVEEWNKRRESGETIANLKNAHLNGANLSGANLSGANLIRADLNGANLSRADLSDACLNGAELIAANLGGAELIAANLSAARLNGAELIAANLSAARLNGANLSGANLSDADLEDVHLNGAKLSGAKLNNANLNGANVIGAKLNGAKLGRAVCRNTVFAFVDLSHVKELKMIQHFGPSVIDVHTLNASQGKIPEVFLRGCGLLPWEIENAKLYQSGLSAAEITDIQYKVFDLRTGPILSGCFISYSHDDTEFVAVLDKKLQKEGGNVWLDKHDFIAGSVEQNIDRAIRINDIVILVLSKASLASDWVWDEIESAFEKEQKQKRRVLCPIAVDHAWKEDPPDKRHLMRIIRERVILDFSEWQTPSRAVSTAFDTPFRKLVDGMKINFSDAGSEPAPEPKL